MNICLLTYDFPHRKTAQVALGLKHQASKLDMLLMPFKSRPRREVLFDHRPEQFVGPNPKSLAKYLGSQVFPYSKWQTLVMEYDAFLVCGSNIIDADFAKTSKIFNVHAGLIPAVRGLDSFKWAIHDMQPIGNTLHCIDERADAGAVIVSRLTPIFREDTLRSFADRHYESEIWMLQNFERLLNNTSGTLPTERPARMRMPLDTEREMIKLFDKYKERFSAGS